MPGGERHALMTLATVFLILCILLRAPSRAELSAWLQRRTWRSSSPLVAASGATLLIVPSVMQTKATR